MATGSLPPKCINGLQGRARHRQERVAVLLMPGNVLGAGGAEFVKDGHGDGKLGISNAWQGLVLQGC